MDEPTDDPRPQQSSTGSGGGPGMAALAVLLLAAVGGGAYWLFSRWGVHEAPPVVAPPSSPPGVTADVGLPPTLPLADGDALLRRLATEGGASAELLGWLGVDGILRRAAATVWMLARGDNPRKVLTFLEPLPAYVAREEAGTLRVDPAAYARYDRLTDALTSIDGARLGSFYAELRPYFDSVFLEITTEQRFDDVLRAAIDRVLALPLLDSPPALVERGALYLYADPALEARSPGEKQLLRFGPGNLARLQGVLRRFSSNAALHSTHE